MDFKMNFKMIINEKKEINLNYFLCILINALEVLMQNTYSVKERGFFLINEDRAPILFSKICLHILKKLHRDKLKMILLKKSY